MEALPAILIVFGFTLIFLGIWIGCTIASRHFGFSLLLTDNDNSPLKNLVHLYQLKNGSIVMVNINNGGILSANSDFESPVYLGTIEIKDVGQIQIGC